MDQTKQQEAVFPPVGLLFRGALMVLELSSDAPLPTTR